jgi:dienelactone hydrolase
VCLRALLGAGFVVFYIVCTSIAAKARCPPDSSVAQYVLGDGLCLAITTFGLGQGEISTLVVVVHGDLSDGGAAAYHVDFAKSLSRPGVVAVALVRPGYMDGAGRVSEGSAFGREDNYTETNIAAVAGAIDTLKRHYRARRVIYVGHSGGAAIGGVVIGRSPGLVNAAVLVACPCDIGRWRKETGRTAWTRSLSPHSFIPNVPITTEVLALTGSDDDNAFPILAQDYARRLAAHGVSARFIAVPGGRHKFSSNLAEASKHAVEELIAHAVR